MPTLIDPHALRRTIQTRIDTCQQMINEADANGLTPRQERDLYITMNAHRAVIEDIDRMFHEAFARSARAA